MAKGTASKSNNLKDTSGLVDALVDQLSKKGVVRLVHLGLFRVLQIKGKKRYSFKTREVVDANPYKQIIFTPARGIRQMLREDKMKSSK